MATEENLDYFGNLGTSELLISAVGKPDVLGRLEGKIVSAANYQLKYRADKCNGRHLLVVLLECPSALPSLVFDCGLHKRGSKVPMILQV